MERIGINTSRAYDVVIGSGILGTIGRELSALVKGRKCAVICDDITGPLFLDTVKESLEAEGFSCEVLTVPHGEDAKSGEHFLRALNFLAERKLTRKDSIIALGGGVVGDLTGFVAATYLRGISFVQIPTTLLAAVDSSVGGKTAINLDAGKNLAGAFYQPSLVLCDTDIMENLPDKIFSDGMAEVIKYGAIRSERVLALIKDGAKKNLTELISECVKIKRDVVLVDEFDTGLRQLLNFGHTPAHAIEKLSGYEISHGSAVAAGMCIMARAAEKLGLSDGGIAKELEELCREYSLPTSCPWSAQEMVDIAMSDKKRGAGKITLIIPKKRGESVLHTVPDSEILRFFESGMGERL